MTTYYVRKTGSDAAAGTSAGAAWLTIGKALSASGLGTGGDTLYIGAGTYRETVTVAMTTATVETKIIGDITGQYTGDAGEVVWTNYTTNDHTVAANTIILDLAARDFLTFQNIIFLNGGSSVASISSAATSTDVKITNCIFYTTRGTSAYIVTITVGFGVVSNWVIDKCLFYTSTTGAAVRFTLTTGTGSDWSANNIIRNNVFIHTGGTYPIQIGSSGTSANWGGGVSVLNCTFFSTYGVQTTTARVSTTYPVTVKNCLLNCTTTGINAAAAGAITEDYNLINSTTPYNNVTAGDHSISNGSIAAIYELGQSELLGLWPRPAYSPVRGFDGMNNFGNATTTAYDFYNAPRPGGEVFLFSRGTATAGGAKTLTDAGKAWGTNIFAGCCVKILSGTGSGQIKSIASNTATVLTVDGNWITNPNTDSVYIIFEGAIASSGTATSGGASTLTDSNAAWGTNQWIGYTALITGGTGNGESGTIASNTGTALTRTGTWTNNPDNTSTYQIYRGATISAVNASPGAVSAVDSAQKETTTVKTGTNALGMQGPGFQDFEIAVDATDTTVTVYTYWDAVYAGTKPMMYVLNGGQCGVADANDTATGSAANWEQLSLNFTPTAAGVVTIRLHSLSTTNDGFCYWDDFEVT